MVRHTTTILRFAERGEKTGWTYVTIPALIAEKLKPAIKKSFRVKGKIDEFPIRGIALLPMGGGDFIMPLNAVMRKGIKKSKGARVTLQLEADDNFEFKLPRELMECLEDEPKALKFFKTLAKSHQAYFIKWVTSAKTEPTKAKRMAQMINALTRQQDFGTMLRSARQDRADLSGS